MRVRLSSDRAGAGFFQRSGEVYDLPRGEALALIRAGSAEEVGAETAVQDAPTERMTNVPTKPRTRGGR